MGLILFVCCPTIASSRTTAGWHTYAQLRHDGHDGWHRHAKRRGDPMWSPSDVSKIIIGWHAYAQPVLKKSEAESEPLEYESEKWHQEKKKLDAMLWASVIILILLFLGLALVTFIRMGRHYRQRITEDKKPEPTEYVDAWSQYRLPEDSEPDDTEGS